MNTPIHNLVPEKNIYSAFAIAPFVHESRATRVQAANLGLYRECFHQVIRDDSFTLHLLMMPNMTGKNVVYTAGDDPDLASSVSNLTKAKVEEDDMIVVVGNDVLSALVTEDDMLLMVMADIAQHLDRIYPVADRTTGSFGRHIGWAAVAGVILGSHDLLRMVEADMELLARIKGAAAYGIEKEARGKGLVDYREILSQNKNLVEAMEKVTDLAFETYGDYISLPASASTIATAAKNVLQTVTNEMKGSIRAII